MTDYTMIAKQIRALAEISAKWLPLFSNACALLYEAMEQVNWAGFYLADGDALLLGPFQGKPACVRIEKGRGVCGAAFREDAVQLVPDVHAFPGHIACDSASNSEIVIPLHRDGAVCGVLDLDSPSLARFSADDEEGLVRFARILEEALASTR